MKFGIGGKENCSAVLVNAKNDDVGSFEIPLRNKRGEVFTYCIIDFNDFENVSHIKWSLSGDGSVHGCIPGLKGKKVKIHHLIMGRKDKSVIDHINGNRLDNRRCNLRFCTQQENTWNNKKSVGVHRHKSKYLKKPYQAYLHINYKKINLGYYKTFEEAISARKEAETKYYGEYSK